MALHIIDLDGTIFEHGSSIPLPGAIELLEAIVKRGDQLLFVTRRGDVEFANHPKYSKAAAIKALAQIGFDSYPLITDVGSPRMLLMMMAVILITMRRMLLVSR